MKCIQLMTIALAVVVLSISTPLHAQFSIKDIYDFNCTNTGCQPDDLGELTLGTDGNLYGTTSTGGTYGLGSVFRISPDGLSYTEWPFDGTTLGQNPQAGLTLAQDGNFYGTTNYGGSSSWGTLFRFNPTTETFTVLHNFTGEADGSGPQVAPVEPKVADGYLYGYAEDLSGNSSQFVPYRVNVAKGTFKSFAGQNFRTTNPLVASSDGYFYGTMDTVGNGSIFRMSTTGVVSMRYNFTGGSDGSVPSGPLVLASDGLLYGTAFEGGLNGTGVIFNFVTKSSTLKPLYSFTAVNSSEMNNDGAGPAAGLIAASDGYLYGTTTLGGTNGVGTAFRIATGGGSFAPLADFNGTYSFPYGTNAFATLMEYTDGSFYAVAANLGANNQGYVYKLTYSHPIISLCCNWWLVLDQPVMVLGQNLEGVVNVTFSGAPAQFQSGSNTYLTAEVPSGAIDGPVVVTLATGVQIESQTVHIMPTITNLDPTSGPVGTHVGIVGGGFIGTTRVTFGGVKATSFTVVTPSLIQAIVPANAKTGKVGVTTPNGSATSKQVFTVN